MGWAATRRDLGGVIFIDLRDREGICQVVARPEVSAAAHAAADRVRGEYVIAVVGEVAARSPETVNPKLPTRRRRGAGPRDPDPLRGAHAAVPDRGRDRRRPRTIRLKYRYLDLRRPRMQRNIMLRHQVTLEVRRYLDEQGFFEIETPFLTKSTPEGARDYLVPSRVHHGQFYALPQSPQIFKQILMVAGFDKYFQIVRCFRDEDLRADRQPEFTQVDIEMSFPRVETIVRADRAAVPARAAASSASKVAAAVPAPDLRGGAWSATARDKPDLRFGMPIADVTERDARRWASTRFPGLIADGARARAIVLPAAGGVSGTRLRKINEELWLGRIVPDARASQAQPVHAEGHRRGARQPRRRRARARPWRGSCSRRRARQKDDTVLVGVDAAGPARDGHGHPAPGDGPRAEARRREGATASCGSPTSRCSSTTTASAATSSLHHPFTAPLDEDVPLLDTRSGARCARRPTTSC